METIDAPYIKNGKRTQMHGIKRLLCCRREAGAGGWPTKCEELRPKIRESDFRWRNGINKREKRKLSKGKKFVTARVRLCAIASGPQQIARTLMRSTVIVISLLNVGCSSAENGPHNIA